MTCTMLDYGVKKARVYNQGVEIPGITDFSAGPFTIIPFENYILYMPFDGELRKKDNLYYLYDSTGAKAVVFSAAGINTLVEYNTPIKRGEPIAICGSYGNSKRGGIGLLGTLYSYTGAGFTLAIYGNHMSDIFPAGTQGGIVDITGTGIATNKQTLVCYHRLVKECTDDRELFAFVRERGSGALPAAPTIKKYLVFDKWSSSQLKQVFVQDTESSFQFIFATYTAGETSYSWEPMQEEIAIHYTKYGNPDIPETAPQKISIWTAVNKSIPTAIRRKCLMTFAPYFPEFDLKWYTRQELYTVGWVCNNSVYEYGNWSMKGPADFGFNFTPYIMSTFSEDLAKNALFVSPETLYIEGDDIASDTARILLLDKKHGVDEIKEYKIIEDAVFGLSVYVGENPVSTVKVWHGIVSSIARYRGESNTDEEKYPPTFFYNKDFDSGLEWGCFGIIEWAPNKSNIEPEGLNGDIIPILFLLSRMGRFPLNL